MINLEYNHAKAFRDFIRGLRLQDMPSPDATIAALMFARHCHMVVMAGDLVDSNGIGDPSAPSYIASIANTRNKVVAIKYLRDNYTVKGEPLSLADARYIVWYYCSKISSLD